MYTHMTKKELKYYSYSPAFKIKIIKEIEELGSRQVDISRKYGIPESTLRGWLNKYSVLYERDIKKVRLYGGHIIMKDEKDKKVSELESKLSDALLKLEVYEEMEKMALEECGIDLKKNFYTEALKQLTKEVKE